MGQWVPLVDRVVGQTSYNWTTASRGATYHFRVIAYYLTPLPTDLQDTDVPRPVASIPSPVVTFHTGGTRQTWNWAIGSPGQLGLRVAGFPGHWVAGSQNVTLLHLWYETARRAVAWAEDDDQSTEISIVCLFIIFINPHPERETQFYKRSTI